MHIQRRTEAHRGNSAYIIFTGASQHNNVMQKKMRKSTADEITAKRDGPRVERSGARLRAWGGYYSAFGSARTSTPLLGVGSARAPASVGEGRWLVRAYYSAMRFRLLAGLLLRLRFRACVCEQGELFRGITKLVQNSP